MQSILGNTRKPDIIVHPDGHIDITARVAEAINLTRGNVVDIIRDDNEYYLYVKHSGHTVGRHQAVAQPSNRRGNHFRVWSKALCEALLNECNTTQQLKLPCGEPIDTMHGPAIPIILKNPL